VVVVVVLVVLVVVVLVVVVVVVVDEVVVVVVGTGRRPPLLGRSDATSTNPAAMRVNTSAPLLGSRQRPRWVALRCSQVLIGAGRAALDYFQ
jgi:hypothetical protein